MGTLSAASRAQCLRMLDRLEDGGSARTALLQGPPPEGWEWLPPQAGDAPGGIALLQCGERRMAVAPFLPLPADLGSAADLRNFLAAQPIAAVVLLRLGHFACGVSAGTRLLASKVGSHYVMGRHKKGGQSANRFARNREKWIRELFDKAGAALQQCLESADAEIERVVTGGDRIVLKQFLARAQLPQRLAERVLPQRVQVDRPNRGSLEAAVAQLCSVKIWLPPESGAPPADAVE